MPALGLLILRLALAAVFIVHGLNKFKDLNGTSQAFDGLGIPIPDLMAPFVASVEVGGGVLLILGLLTPLAGVALAISMLVAGISAHPNAFLLPDGFEYVMVLGAGALCLALTGPGPISLDERLGWVPGRKRAPAPTASSVTT